MPLLIMIAGSLMTVYGLFAMLAVKTAFNEIFAGVMLVGGVTVFALGYIAMAINRMTVSVELANAGHSPHAPVSTEAGVKGVAATIGSHVAVCPNCGRTNLATDKICECGMSLAGPAKGSIIQ